MEKYQKQHIINIYIVVFSLLYHLFSTMTVYPALLHLKESDFGEMKVMLSE